VTSADRWKEISSLFNAALEQAPGERAAFLESACPDAAVRDQVVALLECHDPAERFMTAPAAHVLSAVVSGDPASLVGRQLGSYRIESMLGAGGMGQVYKATDTRLHRTVALKILPLAFRGDSLFQQRFEREAQAIAALRHPHICVLHDIGRDGDTPFLVMEYLEGETLADRLARGPLPMDAVFRIGTEIAEALVEMHAHGIVHRDLKPANIMLTKSGAQLLDFGLARLGQSVDDGPADAGDISVPAGPATADTAGLTSRAGTLAYMAPEQIRGGHVDHRADLFAFGAILYEMLSGAKAFIGSDPAALAAAVLEQEPSPIAASIGAPAGLEAALRKCLRKDPGERWQDASTLAAALRALASAHDTRAARRRTARGVAAVATVLIVGGVIAWRAGAFATLGPSSNGRAATALIPTLTLENVRLMTGADQLEISPSLSPDGRSIVYGAGIVTKVQALVRSLDGGPPRLLHTERPTQNQPRWSPDGTRILYLTLDGLYVVPAAGGTPRMLVARVPLADTRNYVAVRNSLSGAAWSPDGQRVAVVDNSDKSISIVSVTDGRRERIATTTLELHTCDWSPDGRWIACTAGNWHAHFAGLGWSFGNSVASGIVVVSASGGQVQEVTDVVAMNQSPVWSADSRRLYFVSNRARTFDIYSQDMSDAGRPVGAPVRVTTGLGAWSLSFSTDRKKLAYMVTSARANLWSLPIPSNGPVSVGAAEPFTRGNQSIEAMRVSRSGKWVVYDSNLAGTFDIYRLPVGGGQPEQLTSEPGDEFLPDLSPDDRSVVYQSWLTTSRDLFVKTIGGGPPVQITNFPGQEAQPAWSPDGQTIAYNDFTEERGVFRGTMLVRRDEAGRWSAPRTLRTGAWRPAWSPDGTFVVLARFGIVEALSPQSGAVRVVYAPNPNSDEPKAEDVLVSDDGQTLYFKSRDEDGRSQIWSVPVAGGRPRLLVAFGDRPSTRTDLGAGQGRFYFTLDERRSNIWLADVIER
jgi:Tol biopolymer transport system component